MFLIYNHKDKFFITKHKAFQDSFLKTFVEQQSDILIFLYTNTSVFTDG